MKENVCHPKKLYKGYVLKCIVKFTGMKKYEINKKKIIIKFPLTCPTRITGGLAQHALFSYDSLMFKLFIQEIHGLQETNILIVFDYYSLKDQHTG